jgi:hypothetical protein
VVGVIGIVVVLYHLIAEISGRYTEIARAAAAEGKIAF